MAKRSKPQSSHTSLRFPHDVAESLGLVAVAAGWSVARTVSHFIRLGFASWRRQQRSVDELIATYLGAVKLHEVELDNAARLAAARKELRTPSAGRGSRHGTTAAAKAARKPSLPPVPDAKPGSAA